MKKNQLKNSLPVEKQLHSKLLMWKLNIDDCADKFVLEIGHGCKVFVKSEQRSYVWEERKLNAAKSRTKNESEYYGICVNQFEIVCGVYDITYREPNLDIDTKVGIYATCKVYIHNVETAFNKFYPMISDSLCNAIGSDVVGEVVCEKLKGKLKDWLYKTVKNQSYEYALDACLNNKNAIKEQFKEVLVSYGLLMDEASFTIGDIKFEDEFIDKINGKKERKHERAEARREMHEDMQDVSVIKNMLSNAGDEAKQQYAVEVTCPECRNTFNFNEGYNLCPFCGKKLKK